MKLETIKKDKKKRIIIGSMIVLSVVGCLTLTTTRAKYKSVQNVKLASGTVKLNSYDFKIMAMYQSEDGENYTDINTMPESGYVINEEKSYCTNDNKTQVKGKFKTENEKHYFTNLNKNDKCYIWFDKYVPTALETLMANSNYKTSTPTFTSIATSDEGVYRVADGMYGGYSYYWRGAVTNNHVIFDNKCWRVVRINGDGSIRLIYNGSVQSGNTCKGNGANTDSAILNGASYNLKQDNSSYVGWTYTLETQRPSTSVPQTSGTEATLKTSLESWYNTNISMAEKTKLVTGKFCNDRNTKDNVAWSGAKYYAAYARLMEGTKTPTLSCPNGDIYELNVGMITADEVQYAGASGGITNQLYYLYNGISYWTMTPIMWDVKTNLSLARVFRVDASGGFVDNGVQGSNYARPVINLRSDVTFNSGSDGTQNNPYIVQ